MSDKRPTWAVVLVGTLAIAAMIFALLAISNLDISARSELHRDLALRDFLASETGPARFADPSPQIVWLPSEIAIHRSYRAGDLPLWDRRQGGGYSPLLELNGVFHPLRLVALLVPERLLGNFFVIAIAALCFAGFVLYFLELDFSLGVSLVAAGSAVSSSYFLSIIHYYGAAIALVHLPWILWMYTRYRRRAEASAWRGVALIAALLTAAGHPSFIFVTLFIFTTFVAVDVVLRRLPVRSAVRLSFALLCGAAVGAPAWLPFVVSFDSFWTYKMGSSSYRLVPLQEGLKQLCGLVIDAPYSLHRVDYWSFYSYAGPVTSLFAVAGAFWKRTRTAVAGAVVMLPVALFVSVPGPWMTALADLPIIRFTKPWYLFAVFYSISSVLAGFGLQFLCDAARRRRAVLLLLVTVLVFGSQAGRLWRVFQPRKSVASLSATPVVEFLQRNGSASRVTAFRGQALLANAAAWSGIEDLRICAPLLLERYRLWFELVDPAGAKASYQTLLTTREPMWPLLAAFNVRHVLRSRLPSRLMYTPQQTEGFSSHSEENRFVGEPLDPTEPIPEPDDDVLELAFRSRSLEVYRLKEVAPRAYFTSTFRNAATLDKAADELRRNPQEALVRPVVECVACASGAEPVHREVAATYPSESTVRISLYAPAAGVVVLNEALAPGWSAEVDGKPSTILPVNVIARGVLVGPGQHRIDMRYRPPGLIASALLSLLGLASTITVPLWSRFR